MRVSASVWKLCEAVSVRVYVCVRSGARICVCVCVNVCESVLASGICVCVCEGLRTRVFFLPANLCQGGFANLQIQ